MELTRVVPSEEVIVKGYEAMLNERKKHNGRDVYLSYVKKLKDAVDYVPEDTIVGCYKEYIHNGLFDVGGKKGWLADFVKLKSITAVELSGEVKALIQKEYFKCLVDRNFENFMILRQSDLCHPSPAVVQAGYRVFAKRCAFRDFAELNSISGIDPSEYIARVVNREYLKHLRGGRIGLVRDFIKATRIEPSLEVRACFLEEFLS